MLPNVERRRMSIIWTWFKPKTFLVVCEAVGSQLKLLLSFMMSSLVKHYLWVYHYNSPMMNSRIQVFNMENEGFFCGYLDSLLTSLIELRGNEMGHAYGELDGPLIRWKGIIKIPLHAWLKGWEMLNAFA